MSIEVVPMWRWRQELVEKNERMGPATTIIVNVAIWVFCYALVVYLHQLCCRWGWLHSSSSLSMDDVLCAVITGIVVGVLELSDRDKKRQIEERKRQGLDATMI